MSLFAKVVSPIVEEVPSGDGGYFTPERLELFVDELRHHSGFSDVLRSRRLAGQRLPVVCSLKDAEVRDWVMRGKLERSVVAILERKVLEFLQLKGLEQPGSVLVICGDPAYESARDMGKQAMVFALSFEYLVMRSVDAKEDQHHETHVSA